ncbi:hypothetical protein XAC301_11230 [Xanthomonas arboricola pv. corylina]|uniref:IrrE N-terminal-like domain-containing protein n=1 Tax=Xanthomonas arboricola pv. corylina TaxID=487821 RepID=A0ABM8R238_9XANT|nr:hypothetical protein [Xanthomonas arboricola]CAE6728687.1 hypothetical protein XAC301_11230 [Xanthomonas arboricola pv. corylina]CAE6728707.1 hypothetical protein XAC301_11230 [Xanthomonas arboricola pv. corylina]
MMLDRDEVVSCLALVNEVVEHYRGQVLHHDRTMRSVEDLAWIVGEFLQKKVTLDTLKVPSAGKWIRATCIVNDDGSYEIYTLSGLDYDARRFIVCKELFHVILDEEGRRNMDTYSHLQEVTSTFPIPNSVPNSAAVCEYLAEAAAMEFLFPYVEREATITAAGRAGPNHAEVAARYGIPQEYVESYLADGLMTFFGDVLKS